MQLESSPHSLQLERAHVQQQRPIAIKYKQINKLKKRESHGVWKEDNTGYRSKHGPDQEGLCHHVKGSEIGEAIEEHQGML